MIDTLFFDNEQRHIDDFKYNVPNSIPILIHCKENHDHINPDTIIIDGIPILSTQYLSYFHNIGNSYSRLFNHESHPACAAFSEVHYSLLKEYLQFYKHDMIIVFDWDRTLSVIEGLLVPEFDKEYIDTYGEKIRVTVEDTIHYIMGGKTRTEWIKRVFRELVETGRVLVFILTNNGNCRENKSGFMKIIQQIYPDFDDEFLICSDSRNGLTKSLALLGNTMYQISKKNLAMLGSKKQYKRIKKIKKRSRRMKKPKRVKSSKKTL